MNDKELNLDVLENADEDTIKKIAADCPASDEEKERMFAMSRKIYKERTKESEYKNDMEVSGVDVYKRPAWLKFAAAAAAFAIAAGPVTGGGILLKRHRTQPKVDSSETEERAMSPFGDLSGCRVRLTNAAIAPAVFEPNEENRTALLTALNEGEWDKISLDTPLPDGETELIYLMNGTKPCRLTLYGDHTICYEDNSSKERYEIDIDTENAVREAIKYDPEAGDELIYLDVNDLNNINSVWLTTSSLNPDYADVYIPPAGKIFTVPAKNCRFCINEKWDAEAAFSCENIPETLSIFTELEWKEADCEPNFVDDICFFSFRCSDNDSLFNYSLNVYSNGYAYAEYSDKSTGEAGSCMYMLKSQDRGNLQAAFVSAAFAQLDNMDPAEEIKHCKLLLMQISRTDDTSKLLNLYDNAMYTTAADALKAASWEVLPDDAECGEEVCRLRINENLYLQTYYFYDNNVAVIGYEKKKYSVSPELTDTIKSLSDYAWKRAEPHNQLENEAPDTLERGKEAYQNALETNGKFNGGATDLLDIDTSSEGYRDFGDGFSGYLVRNVSSIDEINEMYHQTFSDRYPENSFIDGSPYFERDGKVYWYAGGKGSHIYYLGTEVLGILRRTDDEIFFAVENSYGGGNVDETPPWTEQTEFSVVVQPDGSWKVGKLTVPY